MNYAFLINKLYHIKFGGNKKWLKSDSEEWVQKRMLFTEL